MKFASLNWGFQVRQCPCQVLFKIWGISGTYYITVHISCLPIFNSSVLIENWSKLPKLGQHMMWHQHQNICSQLSLRRVGTVGLLWWNGFCQTHLQQRTCSFSEPIEFDDTWQKPPLVFMDSIWFLYCIAFLIILFWVFMSQSDNFSTKYQTKLHRGLVRHVYHLNS